MLTNFKRKIEEKLGCDVDNCELVRAITKAKDDVVANKLVFGQDVTAEDFETVVTRCIKLDRKKIQF